MFQVVKRREKLFSQHNVPQASELGDASVGIATARHPLHSSLVAGKYGLIVDDSKLLVGRGQLYSLCPSCCSRQIMLRAVPVLDFYSQGGGKSGAHAWQSKTHSIGAVSYLTLQVYELAHHTAFRAVHMRRAALQVFSYVHLSSDAFLCIIPGAPRLSPDGRSLVLDEAAFQIFNNIRGKLSNALAAVKALGAARRKGRAKVNKEVADELGSDIEE
jgi:hypothetical protein